MYILFDTNVWISQLGLRSKNGSAVRFFARQKNATIAIPEVVQLEVQERLVERLLGHRKQIERSYREILPVFGQLRPPILPKEEDFRAQVAGLVANLGVDTLHLPLNLDVARSSMIKALRRQAPSRTKEQFRDGVIWAHCLDLLDNGDVYLVSEDKDFFEERNYEKGLAKELVKEMNQRSKQYRIKLLHDLTTLLEEIQVSIDLDKAHVFEMIATHSKEQLQELLCDHGFEPVGEVTGKLTFFATETPNEVYFRFNFERSCRDITDSSRRAGVLGIEGSGFIDPETNEATEIHLLRTHLDYPDWKPGDPRLGTVSLSAHVNAPEVHTVRFLLRSPEDRPVGETKDRA